jgi:two-component system chemotaxis sensor kinase CheA
VLLAARYEQGHIVITVDDDGHGIDPEQMRIKAIQKGFLTENEAKALTDEEAVNLIFHSGFSTTSVVSQVSGRGVGLDIVRNNIQRLSGTITMKSSPGQGTRFKLLLPVTMVIAQTLPVLVADNLLAIPLQSVASTLAITKKEILTINNRPVVILKDQALPILSIADAFALETQPGQPGRDLAEGKQVVVVAAGNQQLGLLVDQLLDEEDVIVKSFGPIIGKVKGLSNAAIRSDGRVILIADVPDLFNLAGISPYR